MGQTDLTKDQVVTRKRIDELTTEGKPPVVAKLSLGFTVNLGNYESAKIEAGVELEGTADNLTELQARATEEVEAEVGRMLEELKEKSTTETLLGRRA